MRQTHNPSQKRENGRGRGFDEDYNQRGSHRPRGRGRGRGRDRGDYRHQNDGQSGRDDYKNRPNQYPSEYVPVEVRMIEDPWESLTRTNHLYKNGCSNRIIHRVVGSRSVSEQGPYPTGSQQYQEDEQDNLN